MKYKVGDRVRIKSLDWYNENKNICNEIIFKNNSHWRFVADQSNYCGQIATITAVSKTAYHLESIPWNWTDEMIEGLVEEDIIYIDKFQDNNEMIDIIDECVHRLKDNECQINLPEGYIFKDENGNVINATKIVLEKKKKEYPKTYEECYEILGCDDRIPLRIIGEFTRLINARNAYWKIAGDEMGLGKAWKPNWEDENQEKYIIGSWLGTIQGLEENFVSHPFAFPTEEMQDAFYENFKSLIEQCKELL